jgi:imidazolonepropionase-like amidohydrolase
MRAAAGILVVILLVGVCASASAEVDLLITNATLFDARTGDTKAGMAVSVSDGIIQAVESSERLEGIEARRVIDAEGRLLVPGFIDTHGHLIDVLATSFTPGGGGIADLSMLPDSIAVYRREFSGAYLPYGVTVVRDAGSSEEYLPLMRAWMEANAASPDFYPCGGALISYEEGRTPYPGHKAVRGRAEAIAAVRAYHDAGFRHVKLYWRLREPEFRAALSEALRLGMVPFTHIDRGIFSIDAALDLGLRHYEHAFTLGVEVLAAEQVDAITQYAINRILGGDARGAWFMATLEGFNRIGEHDERMLSLIGRLSEAGATVTPTMHVLAKPLGIAHVDASPIGDFDDTTDWTREQTERAKRGYGIMASYVAAMYRAGVELALGTDTVNPGSAALSELLLLRDAGIPMADVLRIGTLGSARVIELSDIYGTIEPGKRAHFVLFDRNPLDDPPALLGGKTVIKDGVVYEGAGIGAPPD